MKYFVGMLNIIVIFRFILFLDAPIHFYQFNLHKYAKFNLFVHSIFIKYLRVTISIKFTLFHLFILKYVPKEVNFQYFNIENMVLNCNFKEAVKFIIVLRIKVYCIMG